MMKVTAAAALLALLLPAVAARTLSSALDSAKDQCLTASAPGLDKAGCEDCVESLAQLNKPMWGCYGQLCQDDELFATTDYPADGAAFGTDSGGADITCTDCLAVHETETCLACATSVPGEYSDLAADEVGAARAYCLACNDAPSTADESAAYPAYPGKLPGFQTASANQGKEAEYRAACGVCANIPETGDGAGAAARLKCAQCMSSTFAMPLSQPGGYLTANEIDRLKEDLGKTTLAATDYPLTDFGKCAFIANLTYSVSMGRVEPTGIYSTCAWSTADFPYPQPESQVEYPLPDATTSGCVDCIDATVDNSTKAYACGLCRNPDWTDNDASIATQCYDCVQNANVSDAWGCSNCFKLEADDDTDSFERDECVTCVTDNLYEGAVGTYNWACGECAGIPTSAVRELCRQCIMTPAMDSFLAGTLEDDLLDASWVGNASEIICSCVDMAKLSTWGENAPGELLDWYSYDCPNCTAIQKMCYMRRNISWPVNIIPDPRPAFLAIPLDGSGDPIEAGPSDGYVSADLCSPPANAAWALWQDDLEVAWGVFQELSNKDCLPATGFEDFETAVAALSAGCDGTPVVLTCALLSAVPPSEDYVVIHLDDFIDVPEETGFGCVDCMKEFSALGQDKYMYACNEYCMNPYTMRTTEQIDQCFTCLSDKASATGEGVSQDVAGCEQCIQAFTGTFPLLSGGMADYDTNKRATCIDCTMKNTSFPENRDWACVACGQLYGLAAEACYTCLEEDVLDPCQCVDGWKRTWLCYEPTPTCVVDGVNLGLLLENTTDSPGLDGGFVQLTESPFNTDTCADIAQQHGAELFALSGSTCYFFQGNLAYLDVVAADFISFEGIVDSECRANSEGIVQRVSSDLEACTGLVNVGASACLCSGNATCAVDEGLPVCTFVPAPFFAPWQRRCVCNAGERYVEDVGCVPEANLPTSDVVVQAFDVMAFQANGAPTRPPQDVNSFCAMGKKLAFCLNDRGTYGTAQRNVGGFAAPWDVLENNMFYSSGSTRPANTQLNIIFAEAGLGNDPGKTFDYMSPFAIRAGWTLTATDGDSSEKIKYRNNRENGSPNADGVQPWDDGFPDFCDPVSATACTGFDEMFNVRGSLTESTVSTGKEIKWSGVPTQQGIKMEMTVLMAGADSENLIHEMTITSTTRNLTDLKFAWVYDPDSNAYLGGSTSNTVMHVFNDADLSQVAALNTRDALPAFLFTTCDSRAKAGTVAQAPVADPAISDYSFADQLATLTFPGASSFQGNRGMFLLFEVDKLAQGESTTLTWTVSFIANAIAETDSAYALTR